MSADDHGEPPPTDPICPMCCLPVVPGAAALFEHGDVIHLDCDLGLMDPGAAVARLRALRGFEVRFDLCIGCGMRRHVVRALRGSRPKAGRDSRTA